MNRIAQRYGEDAYVQAWFELEQAEPFSREARIMQAVVAELEKRRDDQLMDDRRRIDFHRDVGGAW